MLTFEEDAQEMADAFNEVFGDELLDKQIQKLEAELESLEPGDYSYDVVNSELELLYLEKGVDKNPK